MRVLRFLLSIAGGALAGGLVVALVELVGNLAYPLPAGLDPSDRAALAEHVKTLPAEAFLFVLAAWCIGGFAGGFVGRWLAPERKAWPGLIVCLLLFGAALATLFAIPSPNWLWLAGLAGTLFFGLLGVVLAAPGSCRIVTSCTIKAPQEQVFRTLAQADQYSQAVPGIKKIEFLSPQKYGAGTRFRETRVMNGREATAELEITQLIENEQITLASLAGGARWETKFTVRPVGSESEVEMETLAQPQNFAGRMLIPMILGVVKMALEQDLQSIREHCETAREKG